MAELKTKKNRVSVAGFINKVENKQRKADCFEIMDIMKEITKEEPAMWGSSIVGFGSYHYEYASGKTGDWPLTGFSPRKQNLTLYIMAGFEQYEALMSKLGKYKTGKSCLYISSLADIDKAVLKKLIKNSVQAMKKRYKSSSSAIK